MLDDPRAAVAVFLGAFAVVAGVVCAATTRLRLARARGKVRVEGYIVDVRHVWVTTMVTFDYPVPGGWLRASQAWFGSNIGELSIRPGNLITVMVDPQHPERTPEFTSLGLDGTVGLVTGLLAFGFGLMAGILLLSTQL